MIYWSILPLEMVLEGYDDPRVQSKFIEMQIQGVTMVVESISPGQVKIHRLISPCPADFLKPEWAPGQIVNLSP